MTNIQISLAIGMPVVLILSNTGLMLYLFSRVESRFEAMRADMRGDMRTLESIGYDHHGRIKALEERKPG